MYGVFIHKPDSIYDDHPSKQYQFPQSYLTRAQQFEGGWTLFYEPTKVENTRGYYAVGQIDKIIPDPTTEKMYLALITPASYFEFATPVSFRDQNNQLFERGLYNENEDISGRAQSAVRPISESDFKRILQEGLGEFAEPTQLDGQVGEDPAPYTETPEREREIYSGNRIVRSPMFRKLILSAYDDRCAFTGFKIINGGGRAEVEAAHILPVEHNGPDSVQNGIALSGTVHWMFDRGLLGLQDNMEIIVSSKVKNSEAIDKLINKSFIANAPTDIRRAPHPEFLKWHRKECFIS